MPGSGAEKSHPSLVRLIKNSCPLCVWMIFQPRAECRCLIAFTARGRETELKQRIRTGRGTIHILPVRNTFEIVPAPLTLARCCCPMATQNNLFLDIRIYF